MKHLTYFSAFRACEAKKHSITSSTHFTTFVCVLKSQASNSVWWIKLGKTWSRRCNLVVRHQSVEPAVHPLICIFIAQHLLSVRWICRAAIVISICFILYHVLLACTFHHFRRYFDKISINLLGEGKASIGQRSIVEDFDSDQNLRSVFERGQLSHNSFVL